MPYLAALALSGMLFFYLRGGNAQASPQTPAVAQGQSRQASAPSGDANSQDASQLASLFELEQELQSHAADLSSALGMDALASHGVTSYAPLVVRSQAPAAAPAALASAAAVMTSQTQTAAASVPHPIYWPPEPTPAQTQRLAINVGAADPVTGINPGGLNLPATEGVVPSGPAPAAPAPPPPVVSRTGPVKAI